MEKQAELHCEEQTKEFELSLQVMGTFLYEERRKERKVLQREITGSSHVLGRKLAEGKRMVHLGPLFATK